MASEFESMFAASAAPALQGALGLAATYKPPGGGAAITVGLDGHPLLVRVHRNDAHQVDKTVHASGETQSGEIIVMQAQLAKPAKDGRFTVEGAEAWTIITTPVLKNGQHYCTVSRTGVDSMLPRRAGT